jgi:hypothetical protein
MPIPAMADILSDIRGQCRMSKHPDVTFHLGAHHEVVSMQQRIAKIFVVRVTEIVMCCFPFQLL